LKHDANRKNLSIKRPAGAPHWKGDTERRRQRTASLNGRQLGTKDLSTARKVKEGEEVGARNTVANAQENQGKKNGKGGEPRWIRAPMGAKKKPEI